MNQIKVKLNDSNEVQLKTVEELLKMSPFEYEIIEIRKDVVLPIRLLRMNRRVDSKELANLIKRSESMIFQYERGDFEFPKELRGLLSKALDVDVDNIDYSKLGNALYAGSQRSIDAAKKEIEMLRDQKMDYKALYLDLKERYNLLVEKTNKADERAKVDFDKVRQYEKEQVEIEIERIKKYYENKKIVKIARKLGLWKD